MEQAKFQVNNALINIYFSLKNSEPTKYPITGIVGCCARNERPHGSRAAEQRDELASPHAGHGTSLPGAAADQYHLGTDGRRRLDGVMSLPVTPAQRNKPPLGSRGAFDRDSQTVARIQPESFRFETMNSSPRLAGVAEDGLTVAFHVLLNRMPAPALANTDVSVTLRTWSGSRRRSSPFNSIRSKPYRNTRSSLPGGGG